MAESDPTLFDWAEQQQPIAIPLTKGRSAIIDAADEELVTAHSWCAIHVGKKKKRWYAASRIKQQFVLLHRFLMGAEKGQYVDHVNGDSLDNRRSNLRLATGGQNARNQRALRGHKTTRFKGVRLNKNSKKFHAYICTNYTRMSLGYFDDETQAALAYDAAARKYHGEFACLNFPQPHERGIDRGEPQQSPPNR